MINAITKNENDKSDSQAETSSSSIANKLKMFNLQNKKQSIVVGSSSLKNIHSSNINSFSVCNNQVITTDYSGFVKVWKF